MTSIKNKLNGLIFGFLLIISPIAQAKDVTPEQFVTGMYNGDASRILWPDNVNNLSILLSKRLTESYKQGFVLKKQFTLSFDPILNGQDAKITNLLIHPAIIDKNIAQVMVSFLNFESHNVLVYSFVREIGIWKLDEIASIGGEFRWLLTDIVESP